jgi:hypothetical protein
MMRSVFRAGSLMVVLAAMAAPASAQVIHSFTLGAGVFAPRSFDTRVAGDVLVANLTQPEVLPGVTGSLEFGIKKFRAYPVFGEWNVSFGNHVEIGAGVGFYQRAVNSRYADLVNGARNNADIEQTLRLRVIPLTGVVRFLPFGEVGGFQPYVGVGVAVLNFRYSETGEFVDLSDFAIFQDRYVANGTAVGGLVLGGLRLPMGGDVYALTLEGRYQRAEGKTGGLNAGFLGDKIDLSGAFFNIGFLIRF